MPMSMTMLKAMKMFSTSMDEASMTRLSKMTMVGRVVVFDDDYSSSYLSHALSLYFMEAY